MSDSSKMSRRDWFRLVPRHSETETTTDVVKNESAKLAAHTMGAAAEGLQAIPHPENHDGMDLAQLPPMREAILTDEQVRQLFADIEAFASDILLTQRLVGSVRASVSSARTAEQLLNAERSLLSHAIPRMQIRYHWQASHWIDTLEWGVSGIRLVRINHDPRSFANAQPRNVSDRSS